MKEKTVVVTGGTSGIGEVAAEKLAEMGARIVLVARDRSRGEGTLARLREKAPGLAHTRISEMKRVAAEVAKAKPRFDVLVNDAGAIFSTRKLTEDGLEYTFALNHMAYFVVTQGLRDRLVASASARVVSTASAAHQGATPNFDGEEWPRACGRPRPWLSTCHDVWRSSCPSFRLPGGLADRTSHPLSSIGCAVHPASGASPMSLVTVKTDSTVGDHRRGLG